MPFLFSVNGGDLDRSVIIDSTEPREQWTKQLLSQSVFVVRILFNQTAQGGSGDHPHIPGKSAFVLLVCNQRIDVASADQRDMAGLARAKVFLKENALSVIDMLEPGAGILLRLADDRMDGA